MHYKIPHSIYILLLFFLFSCSNTKHLPAGGTLYVGSKVAIKDKEAGKKDRKKLTADLEKSLRPKPNTKTLGIRFKLMVYTHTRTPQKKKSLRTWLKNKIGEPPVLASSVNLHKNEAILLNTLQNRGYFHASVSSEASSLKNRKSQMHFSVITGKQFTINKVVFRQDTDRVYKDIDSDFTHTLLTKDAPYNLDLIKGERTRIDKGLKEKGYFYFNPNYILVQVDTNIGNYKANMYVTLKQDSVPDEAYNIYSINDIFIYADYRLGKSNDTDKNEGSVYKNLHIVDKDKNYDPSLFSKAILFNKGDVYSADNQNRTLSRLVNLGTFKFVKNRYQELGDSVLDVYYYLTPFPRKSLHFEIGALTQNDDRVGTEGSISWHNHNSFKGGEELLFKINGGIEKQFSSVATEPNIYNFGAETDLTIPHYVVPFFDITSYSQFMPRTVIKAAYKYESESDLLRINSYTLSYGYDWKENPQKQHQLYPFNITYVKTDTLGNADKLGLLYGNLIFDGVIIGPTYEFTYSSQANKQKKNTFFFDGLIDLSGNILGLAEHANYYTNPQKIFGTNYAQYLKFQTDFRYYRRFSKTTILANRLFAGLGIPYGNSFQLPNIKQFWAGGNSDLRGFPSRLVGPGTFNEYTAYNSNAYLETLGDMKLEFNTELRQTIYDFFGIALFFDAGNIWSYHSNPAYPGGQFTSQFYKELAADIGIGFRFDFQIFIIRMDIGMPVSEPWLTEGDRLVLDNINGSWVGNNLVLNFGIGYPF